MFIQLLALTLNLYAADITTSVINAVPVGKFKVGIGSTINLKTSNPKIQGPAIFLGSAIAPNGTPTYQMYLNTNTSKVYYIDASNFKKSDPNFQTTLDLYEQAGGTCTGYAIDDFLQQTHLSGFMGNGKLSETLSTEEGRTHLLVDSVNQYYLTLSHRYSIKGILNGYGKEFGFKCDSFQSKSFDTVKKKLLDHLNQGLPVIVSFSTGSNMYPSPFSLELFDQENVKMDNRLWIPRKIGERENGGHSIVAAAAFNLNNKVYMLMIDSDWSEPRIWDMDAFLNQKTALEEITFVSCK